MIIGITGTNGSGKDTVANYLILKGFTHYSLSDIIREETKKRKLPVERNVLIAIGNELREKHGENVLASLTLEKIEKNAIENAVITSIRNPGEINELRKNKNFYLLGVDAPAKIRYKRVISRARENEKKISFKEFVNLEEKEKTAEKNKQQLGVCLKMADKIILNDSLIEDLYKKTEDWINSLAVI